MQERLDRFQDRASKRRDTVKEVMMELDLKKILAPDFSDLAAPGASRASGTRRGCGPKRLLAPQRSATELASAARRTERRLGNRRRCPLQPEPVLSVRAR